MRRADAVILLVLAASPAALAAQGADTARHSVALAEAIRLAEATQPGVVQARANIQTADARVRAATGAYLPSLSLSATGNQSFSATPARVDQTTGQLISGNTNGNVSGSLNTSVDLFTGFRRGADSRSAKANRTAADASLVNARAQQDLATTNAFFDALSAAQLVGVRQEAVQLAQEQFKISVDKLHAGSATRADSLSALVTLGTAQTNLLQAQTQQATAEATLARTVGQPGRVAAADDSAFYRLLQGVDTAAVRAEARAQSPQVQATAATALAAGAAIGSARAAYWPTLTLSAGIGMNGSKVNRYQLYSNRSASLSLNWPIFNRFSREQNIAQAESQADVAEAQAADAVRAVDANLTQQFAQLDAAGQQIGIAQTSVAAARENLRVQRERYRVGVATIVDVLTAQSSLSQAEVDALTARYTYLRAKAAIEAVIGRSL